MIDLTKATVEEMRAYARNELGVNPPASMTKSELSKTISDAMSNVSQDDVVAATPIPVKPGEKPKVNNRRMQTILIHKTGEKGGDRDVFVGCNGKSYLIQRGVEVPVPFEVVDILKNAVEDKYEWVPNSNLQRGGEMVKRSAQAYPFSIVG